MSDRTITTSDIGRIGARPTAPVFGRRCHSVRCRRNDDRPALVYRPGQSRPTARGDLAKGAGRRDAADGELGAPGRPWFRSARSLLSVLPHAQVESSHGITHRSAAGPLSGRYQDRSLSARTTPHGARGCLGSISSWRTELDSARPSRRDSIARELLLRRKVADIVACCPPSMLLQWREEMESRFGLLFQIIDRAYVHRIRKERGYNVNPWGTHNRFIISHNLIKDEEYASDLRNWLGRDLVAAPFASDPR